MNDVKLCDFTVEQLQVMLNALVLLRHEKAFGRYMANADDDINLCITQVKTAIGIVGRREQTVNN